MKTLTENYLNDCRTSLQREQEHSLSTTNGWSHVDKAKVHADWDLLYKQLTPLVETCTPDSDEVQRLISQHYGIASRFYVPSRQAYIGIGILYRENVEMRRFHNNYHPLMADFLEAALRAYALNNL